MPGVDPRCGLIADLGTGDGRFALALAAANPERLVLGIDPVASAMAETSRRAAQPARRGGLPNAAFVVASAECPPPELAGRIERLTINLPWGSLLRGALALPDAHAASRGIATLLSPGGTAELLLAPAPKDRLATDVDVRARVDGSLPCDWHALGLDVLEARPATEADLAATQTTWSKRLRLTEAASDERDPWFLLLTKRGWAP